MLTRLVVCACVSLLASSAGHATEPDWVTGRVQKPTVTIVLARSTIDEPAPPGLSPRLSEALAFEVAARAVERKAAVVARPASDAAPDPAQQAERKAALDAAHGAVTRARAAAIDAATSPLATPGEALVVARLRLDEESDRIATAYDAWSVAMAHRCEGLRPEEDCGPEPSEPRADYRLVREALDRGLALAHGPGGDAPIASRLEYLAGFVLEESGDPADLAAADAAYVRALAAAPGELAAELHLRRGLLAEQRAAVADALAHYLAVPSDSPLAELAAGLAVRALAVLGRCDEARARRAAWQPRSFVTNDLAHDVDAFVNACGR